MKRIVLALGLVFASQSVFAAKYQCTVQNQGHDLFYGEAEDQNTRAAIRLAQQVAKSNCEQATKVSELPCDLVECKFHGSHGH
jgi:hypothetical protein